MQNALTLQRANARYNKAYEREDFLCPIQHEVMDDPVITPG
jgi:hypothetical protein